MLMKKNELQKMFSRMPELSSPRLLLRRLSREDAADFYEYARLPSVTEYLLWYPHSGMEHTRRYLALIEREYRMGMFYDWAVVLRESGKMIGTCGFAAIDSPNACGEVGYVLNPDFWGQGYAPEAVRAVMAFGFGTLSLHRIEARYILGNDRSRRVMEKCGMRFEGVRRSSLLVKGEYRDIGVCAILSSEFYAAEGN